jgi:hypothetical protein
MSELGKLFRQRREAAELKVGELALLAGYQNVSNGGVQIHALEKYGHSHPDLLKKLAAILEIREDEYQPLVREEKMKRLRAWVKWLNEPIKPSCFVIHRKWVAERYDLPEWIATQEQAEAFVSDLAREKHLRCYLHWSRQGGELFFAADGSLESICELAPR